MYVPPHFDERRSEVLQGLITNHPFGTLVTHGASGLDANHIPFELVAGDHGPSALRAHVARANPVWQDVKDGDEVLAIFGAGDAYVSPSSYPSKHEHHRQVPTWNYRVVHVHGRITVRDDVKFVRGVVGRLTRTHEAAMAVPWKMTDAPKDYLEALLLAIVGLEIAITRIVGKSKLSQNKDARDLRGAAEALHARGEQVIGDAMRDALAAKVGGRDDQ
ncbi:MAG: FMN-binding negative transcriptional regulator [Polyangiales bacterium]